MVKLCQPDTLHCWQQILYLYFDEERDILYLYKDKTMNIGQNIALAWGSSRGRRKEGTLEGEAQYLTVYHKLSPNTDSI